jgi:hypothetical protein
VYREVEFGQFRRAEQNVAAINGASASMSILPKKVVKNQGSLQVAHTFPLYLVAFSNKPTNVNYQFTMTNARAPPPKPRFDVDDDQLDVLDQMDSMNEVQEDELSEEDLRQIFEEMTARMEASATAADQYADE